MCVYLHSRSTQVCVHAGVDAVPLFAVVMGIVANGSPPLVPNLAEWGLLQGRGAEVQTQGTVLQINKQRQESSSLTPTLVCMYACMYEGR